jgi:GTPase SAR1 family protein
MSNPDPIWRDATSLKTAVILGAPGSGKTTLVESWIADYKKTGGDVVILDPSRQFPGEGVWPEEGPEKFLMGLKGKFRGLLVLDDADRYLSATPRGIWRDLFTSFRHWGVNLLVVARRPQGIPKDVIASADEIIIFRLSEVHARSYLGKLLGRDVAEDIPRDRFRFLMISPFDPENMEKGQTKPRAIKTVADEAAINQKIAKESFWDFLIN